MAYEETKAVLLQQHDDDSDSEYASYPLNYDSQERSRVRSRERIIWPLIWTTLACSLSANFLFVWFQRNLRSQAHLCVSEYTGLGLSTSAAYLQHTDYIHENRTIADDMWDSIDTSPNTIALDREYAKKHGLALSIPFPWDPSKGLYLIKAFHHMHCLKNIRRAYLDALDSHPGQEQLIPEEHILHCLDIMRQDIKCRPDDTPMPSIQQRHKWGDGQERKCKDWDALVRWTRDPKRHACFRMLSDYRRVPHSLEQFAFCLEDSPYTDIMEAYFAEHGHRDPYSLDGETGGNEAKSGDY